MRRDGSVYERNPAFVPGGVTGKRMMVLGRFESKLVPAGSAFICGMTASVNITMAQDLEAGVSSAASELRRVVKVGLTVAAVIMLAVRLVVSALQFSRKEPDAV